MASLQTRLKRAGIVAVFTFGFTALAAVLSGPGPATIGPAIAVFGWFVLAPAVAIFDIPVIDAGDERATRRDTDDAESGPLETLQERYAAGEISEDEFDRKVERLLASGVDGTSGDSPGSTGLGSIEETDVGGVTSVEDLTDAGTATGNHVDRSEHQAGQESATETNADR